MTRVNEKGVKEEDRIIIDWVLIRKYLKNVQELEALVQECCYVTERGYDDTLGIREIDGVYHLG